jgi:outer membrane immunogenic protein
MKRTIFAIIAVVAMALPFAAQSADLSARAPVYKAPPPAAPVFSFSGCYVGAGGGYNMADIDHSVTNTAGTATFDIGHDNALRGWLATVSVGCDYQIAPSWVIGVNADFDFNTAKGRYSFNCPGGCVGPTGYIGEQKERGAWFVGGRLGYVVMPQLLTYFTGGYTQARLKGVNYVDAATNGASGLTLPAQTYSGWYLGAGDEYALSFLPGLFWKNEYRFSQFQRENISQLCGAALCGGAGTVNSVDHSRLRVQSVRSELIYRFNWAGGPVTARY